MDNINDLPNWKKLDLADSLFDARATNLSQDAQIRMVSSNVPVLTAEDIERYSGHVTKEIGPAINNGNSIPFQNLAILGLGLLFLFRNG